MATPSSKTPRKRAEPILQMRVLDPRLGDKYNMPRYATEGSAGMDLRAMIPTATLTIRPGETFLIPTGIAIHIKDRGLAGLIIPRSGLGHNRGIVMGNGTGLIDSDYTGPVFVSCWNRSSVAYTITAGERIAQLVLIPVVQATIQVVQEFDWTARGEGGFSSTGTV